MKLGLLAPRQSSWAAGTIYLHNLIGALSLLSDNEKPSVFLFLGPKSRISRFTLLEDLRPPIYFYSHRKNFPVWKKLVGSLVSIAKLKMPVGLENLIQATQTSVLFPFNFPSNPSSLFYCISWIPDFQHLRQSHYFSDKECAKRNHLYQQYINLSDHLIVSSQDSYRDLNRYFSIDPYKVSVLPFVSFPFSSWYQHDPVETENFYQLPSKFLIFPSQFWIHKNHRLLFTTIKKLRDSGLNDIALVCTGYTYDYRHPDHFRELKQWIKIHHLQDCIYILGLLPRLKQVQLIRRSCAVIQCSLFEGWSAIVEDAVALGKRIYLSEIPVHREQNPPQARFFDPKDSDALAVLLRSDWADLEPGPNAKQEEQARNTQQIRARTFAENFLDILKKIHHK